MDFIPRIPCYFICKALSTILRLCITEISKRVGSSQKCHPWAKHCQRLPSGFVVHSAEVRSPPSSQEYSAYRYQHIRTDLLTIWTGFGRNSSEQKSEDPHNICREMKLVVSMEQIAPSGSVLIWTPNVHLTAWETGRFCNDRWVFECLVHSVWFIQE